MEENESKEFPFYLRLNDMMEMMDMVAVSEDVLEDEHQYAKRLFPREMKYVDLLVDDCCDRYEYEGSRMFHECLDKEFVWEIADEICSQLYTSQKINMEFRQMVYMQVLYEMCHRRGRYLRRKSRFSYFRRRKCEN